MNAAVIEVREPNARYLAQTEPALLRGFELLATAPGGVAKLRALIHSLAVRGLLVLREPSEEPGNALLQRLLLKQATTGKGTLGFGDVEATAAPYEVPAHWAWARLSQLVENMGSGWSPACDEGERTDPNRWAVLRTTAVQVMEYRPQEHKAIPTKLSGRPAIEVKDGDILITRAGPMNRVGISCWVDHTPPRLMLSDKIVRFHATDDEMLPAFIVLALNAGWTKDQLEVAKTGMAASQVNISQSDLRGMLLPVCSKAEQQRIVARVEELTKFCDALEQSGRLADEQHALLTSTLFDALAVSESAHALAENWQRVAEHFNLLLDRPEAIDALEQTILQLSVRGLLVPQDESDESARGMISARSDDYIEDRSLSLPFGWESVGFLDICGVGGGSTPSKSRADFWAGQIPWVSPKDMKRDVITDSIDHVSELAMAETSLSLVPTGSVLIVVRGMILAHSFPTAITATPVTINQDMKALTPRVAQLAPYLALVCRGFKREILSMVERSTHGTCKLESSKLYGWRFGLPPLAEQNRIIIRVEELRRLCAQLRKRLDEARETQTLLADALVVQATVA